MAKVAPMAEAPKMEKQVIVRMPPDLLAALREDAAANGRTVSQSVRFHVAKALGI